MSTEITMPKLSDTMEEGKILRWLKHPGDQIHHGEPIAEIETDKADMVMEAFDDGRLDEIRVKEGESAKVGAVIAVLRSDADAGRPTESGTTSVPREPAPAEQHSESNGGSARPKEQQPTSAEKPEVSAESQRGRVASMRQVRRRPATVGTETGPDGIAPSAESERRPQSPAESENDSADNALHFHPAMSALQSAFQ